MKKSIFGGICVVVGGVVGAGFATGREIFLYFYGKNIWVAAISCFAFFFVSIAAVCINKGKYLDKNSVIVKVIRIIIMCCYFIVLAIMLAAANSLLSQVFGLNAKTLIMGFLCAVICCIILYFDMDGIKVVNVAAVPMIMIFICVLFCSSSPDFSQMPTDIGFYVPIRSAGYVGLNLLLMFGILTELSKQYTAKQLKAVAFFSSLILSLSIVLILIILSNIKGIIGEMPLIDLAKQKGGIVYLLAVISVLLAVITTLQCSAYPLVKWQQEMWKDKFFGIAIVLFFGLLVSMAGFVTIIELCYPIISVFGVAIVYLVARDNKKLYSKRNIEVNNIVPKALFAQNKIQ